MQRLTRLKWPINPTRLTRLSCPEVGDVDCHSDVGFLFIGADDGCLEAGNFICHSSVDFFAIEVDGCPEAGGHSGVDPSAIEADGCPEAGGHSGVDFSAIKADGCPEAGDFVCHLSVMSSLTISTRGQ
jgi:hypothetical protein